MLLSFRRALVGLGMVAAITIAAIIAATSTVNAAENNYAAIVVDAKTGEVLFSRNADLRRYPASLTKMMTLYLIFEDLERGKISLSSRLSVSTNAANQAPSKLGLAAGSTIRVEDAILALVTKSANDVAMAVAENLSASAAAFAQRMTSTARSLGMNSTTFRNPHGLPDSGQITTARDMATLGRALQDRFPQYFGYFSTRSFTWNGVTYSNHNNLLGNVTSVDGIKTGYTRASGYNLVTSLKRDNRHVVAVVMGGNSSASRDQHMRDLIAAYLPRAYAGLRTAPLVVASPLDLIPVPLPRANPARTDPVVTAAITPPEPILPAAEGDFDPMQPPPPLPIGWAIQIGAFPSEAAAYERLTEATLLEGTLLASVTPRTETVIVDGVVHYRARFVGFLSRDEAWAACSDFEHRGIACYVPQ